MSTAVQTIERDLDLDRLAGGDLLEREDTAVVTAAAAAAASGETATPNLLICNSAHWCLIIEPL
jgi:hypothetical protein